MPAATTTDSVDDETQESTVCSHSLTRSVSSESLTLSHSCHIVSVVTVDFSLNSMLLFDFQPSRSGRRR